MITSDKPVSEKMTATQNNEGKLIKRYVARRLVTATVDYTVAQLYNLLPYKPGVTYGPDTAAYVLDVDIDRRPTIAPHCAWDVTVNLSTEASPQEMASVNPVEQRVKRSWTTSEQTIYIIQDRDGNLIVNAADQPFDGGVAVSIEVPTLVYERNESTFSGAFGVQWSNSLNQFAYSGAAPGTLKLKITASEVFESDFTYWAVRYEMAYLEKGWQPQPLNAGLMQLISGELKPCLDRNSQPVTAPVPLYPSGQQIPESNLPGDANYVYVQHFPENNFGLLGLEQFV